ncbi:MAG: peptidoglycan DD-metalloendopeptidase family protein [Nitrospirae bacterium]|nr:peptidoglycan DD-metalloendopeptidase family protein [Nitrospirota bacterium]
MGNRKWEVGNKKSVLTSHFLLLTSCFLLLTSYFLPAHAADPKSEYKKLQERLNEEKKKAKEALRHEQSILSELEEIDKALAEKSKELRRYDRRIKENQAGIKIIEEDIKTLSSKLEARKRFLKERLRSLYKQQRSEAIAILLSAEDYQDLMRKTKHMSLLAYHDRKVMEDYNRELIELDARMHLLETLQKELEINNQRVKDKQEEMQLERQRKYQILASIKHEKTYHENMIKELEESSRRLLELIKELEKKELPPPTTGTGFASLKGRLIWPVEGKVLVPFGSHKNPEFNIPVFKNGIEIQANAGEPAKAVYRGRVVYADWFKGYGQLLIINHGDGYHSLYAHLSEIFHKTGDIIKEQQVIGKVGESGMLNIPSLYFEIRHKGKPLNPTQWLRKK